MNAKDMFLALGVLVAVGGAGLAAFMIATEVAPALIRAGGL